MHVRTEGSAATHAGMDSVRSGVRLPAAFVGTGIALEQASERKTHRQWELTDGERYQLSLKNLDFTDTIPSHQLIR